MRYTMLLAGVLGLGLTASPVLSSPMPAGNPWDQDAARADALGADEGYRGFLKQAEDAVQQGHLAFANELVERAEARLLTRSTLATKAEAPDDSNLVRTLSKARAALGRHDRAEALRLIGLAASMPAEGPQTGLN